MSTSFLDLPPMFWACVAFIFGACAGSFANVCIYRIPLEMSIVSPGSKCPHCGTRLTWRENIPLISWMMLGARCKTCEFPISVRYPIVEMLTGGLFALVVWAVGFVPATLVYIILVWSWVVLSGIDWDHQYIPDRINITGMVAGPLIALGAQFSPMQTGLLIDHVAPSLLGLALGGGVIWTIRILGHAAFKQEAMGFGDVKLMAFVGAFLGWRNVLLAIFLATLIGSIAGILAKFAAQRSLHNIGARDNPPSEEKTPESDDPGYTRIPFGPYLVLGGLLALIWGDTIWAWYWIELPGSMP